MDNNPAIEQLYRQAIEAAGAVAYSLDYPTDTYTFISDGITAMTGYGPDEITPALWRSLHRETILGEEAAGLTLEEARKMARAGELKRWQGDYRIETRNGRSRWITNAAVIQVDEAQGDVRSIGILIDITDRKEAEQILAQQAAELRALNRRLTRQGWDDFLSAEPAGVQFAFEMPVADSASASGREQNGQVAGPLTVRGEPIGQILVSGPQNLPEDAEEIVAEVAERLSAHLENLRLTRQTEGALADSERRARYQTHVALAVAALTEHGLAALPDVLRLLGEAVRVSSVFYGRAGRDEQGEYWQIAAEWCAPGVQPVAGDPLLQHIDAGDFPSWKDMLVQDRMINSADPQFPAAARTSLRRRNIQSLLMVPLPGDQETPDFLGFNESTGRREWGEDEIAALRTTAAALASISQRDSLYAQAQARAERERRVRAAVDRVRRATSQEDILQVAREELGRMLGGAQTIVQLNNPDQD